MPVSQAVAATSAPTGVPLKIVASGDPALNIAPTMTVYADGVLLGNTSITANNSAGQKQAVGYSLAVAPKKIEIAFPNDYYNYWMKADRNLYVYSLTVGGVNYAATAAVYDRDSVTWVDSKNIQPGQIKMAWAGKLVFTIDSTTPFPLGFYGGNPNPSNQAAETAFENTLGLFTRNMGAAPQYMDVFTDYTTGGWNGLLSSAKWGSYALHQCAPCKGIIPVVSLPMLPATAWGAQKQNFKDIAAGLHDDIWTGVARAYASYGFKTIYFRIGIEQDAGYFPWGTSYAASMGDWVAAFQHIATALRSVSGVDVKILWNPAQISWTPASVVSGYPGDDYVDVIAIDTYSPLYPCDLTMWNADGSRGKVLAYNAANAALWAQNATNREHDWNYPGGSYYAPTGQSWTSFSLLDAIKLAKAHNKPIALGETGAGGNGANLGPVDDPVFPQWLAETLHNADVPVAFVNIWDIDVGDGRWNFTNAADIKPLEAAAWAKYFGVAGQ